MAAEIRIVPEAEDDIGQALDWYEERRLGLGDEFFGCVEATLHYISREPEVHAKVKADYRRVLVRRFPYAVFYEFADNTVTIYGVLHTSRDPEKWRSRLK